MKQIKKMRRISELKKFRDKWLKKYHNFIFYDYQRDLSDAIIEAVFRKNKKGDEFPVEFSRQSGKTQTVVYTVTFIIAFHKLVLGKGIRIGIFAPQKEQAKTDFDRIKRAFFELKSQGIPIEYTEANATTLRPEINSPIMTNISIGSGNEIYIFPVSKTSHPESKTLDLIIFEESQDIDDETAMVKVFPMGAATNATRIFVGTAGYRICYFYRLLQKKDRFIYNYKRVIEDKRKLFEATGDEFHLNYNNFIVKEIMNLGEQSDEFQSQYNLKWILGTGQFCTAEDFAKIQGDYSRVHQNKQLECYIGVDTAKDPDSTVVTVLGYDKEKKSKKILNWLELRGDNYQDQFDIIWDFIQRYNTAAIAIDSTGQGDFMPDMFERHTYFTSEPSGLFRVKFSLPTKDILYKNLGTQIKEFLTSVPKIETKEAEKFKQQMIDLQKEYKGNLLSCHHPEDAKAHDDYCDSFALAEYAFYKFNERQPEVVIIEPKNINENKKIEKINGQVVDYWPGVDDLWE